MKIFTAVVLFFFTSGSFAQHDSALFSIKPVESNGMGKAMIKIPVNKTFKQTGGWTEKLKDAGKVNIIYDYNNMGVCEYTSEKSYLEHKQERYGAKKYAKFLKEWKEIRKLSAEPKFKELFNKYIMEIGIMGFNDTISADATLKVEILYIDVEHHSVANAPPPYIKMVCTFFSKGNLLARYEFNAIGYEHIKNIGESLTECFGRAGKMLANGIVKKMRTIEKYGPINNESKAESED